MKVLCLINNGFEETETFAPVDILKRGGVEVTIASNTQNVIGAHKVEVSNILLLKDINVDDFDLLLLPGGPHFKINREDELYKNTILKFNSLNKPIASICASPTILGQLGLLEGKKYTCFPPMNKEFGGTFTGDKVNIDGNLITSRAAGTSLEFGFSILEYLLGEDVSNKVKDDMFY